MSLPQAWRGAQAELAGIHGPAAKLHRLAGITRTFCVEILQQFLVIPYAVRALRTYHSLPRLQLTDRRSADSVSLVQSVRYGMKQRNVMDVYLPAAQTAPDSNDGLPVVLFCHGGVWAAGDKWHYAPMATRLAGAGVLTLVMHYSLYPDALVPEMVTEVSQALSWTLDNVASVGGDPARVSVVGHSAGAQLATMALLHRAAKHTTGRKADAASDARMPKRLVGMAGVYDLTKHLQYEAQRQVAELSTMKRAAGGAERFPDVSPVVILAHALQAAQRSGQSGSQTGSGGGNSGSPPPTPLRGEALAHRIGFERPRAPMAKRMANVIGPGPQSAPNLQLSLAQAQSIPPVVLMSSCRDIIVPWYESAEIYWMLHDCGVKCRHLVYWGAAHADFVTGWRTSPTASKASSVDDLPDQCRDLLTIVRDEQQLT